MSSVTTSGISSQRREFLTVAEELAVFNGRTVQMLREEASSQGVPAVQVALQKALITPAQLEIIETLCRPFEIVPGYEIRNVIGQGGMGVVFRAKQLSLKRDVAIKLVPLHQLGGNVAVKRFEKEAQVVAKLQHPNIVAAYDFGQHEGRLYFVMEFVDGEDADHHIRRHGCFEEHAAWHLLRQVAAGLAHAKQARVVHRDVKPANILLVRPPAGYPLPAGVPMAKLSDFGLAWLTTASDERTRLTATNVALGSPHYMAPEQFAGATVDWRADIYSLGATAFHLLTGLPPHAGLDITRLMALKLQGKSESLRIVRPDLSAATTNLVEEMMAGDPNARPQDYGVLLERIDSLLGSEITESKRINASGRALVSTQIAPPPQGLGETAVNREDAVDPTAPTQPAIPAGDPRAVTMQIPATGPQPRMISRGRRLTLVAAALVLLALGAGAFHLWNMPGARDLQVVPPPYGLWKSGDKIPSDSGSWTQGNNSLYVNVRAGEESVLQGEGAATCDIVKQLGMTKPFDNYQLELMVDLHQASAVEVHVGFAPPDGAGQPVKRDDRRVVLRVAENGSQLGLKTGDFQGWVPRGSLVPLPQTRSGKHHLRLERHTGGWWVFVDGNVVGYAMTHAPRDANRFRLIAENGQAWFSDLVVSEMRLHQK